MENMSRKMQVYLSDTQFETLDLIQDEEPQTFQLTKTKALDKIKLAIESTFGGKNAGGQIKVMGVRCEDPFAKEKQDKKDKDAAMGKEEVIKAQAKNCEDTMDSMESEKGIVDCLEDCAVKDADITEVSPGVYTTNSAICQAMTHFSKGKEFEGSKQLGVLKIPNTEGKQINGSKPP